MFPCGVSRFIRRIGDFFDSPPARELCAGAIFPFRNILRDVRGGGGGGEPEERDAKVSYTRARARKRGKKTGYKFPFASGWRLKLH